jgi:hypothetical protein
MSTEGNGPNFWTTLPGILSAVAGLVAAVTGLLVALNQLGVIGTDSTTDPDTAIDSQTGGESDLPPPFESTGMYEMARYLFDPDECFQVRSAASAPLAWRLEPRPDELVKCELPESYRAVFMCTDTKDVASIREAYLGEAIEETTAEVPWSPAGWDEPTDGVQISFEHVGSHEARIYWDSPTLGCAAELQSTSATVEATVDYWVNGK